MGKKKPNLENFFKDSSKNNIKKVVSPVTKKTVKSNNENGDEYKELKDKLWISADKLRSNMDAAVYKHVVLGLIFLKYISDTFTTLHDKLQKEVDEGADPEDKDEYLSKNVFWVPREARWNHLQANAKQPTIGKTVDDAMDAIERDNLSLKGVLPKDYAREALDKQRLGELIDLIGTIGLGDPKHKSVDILGMVYEYFLGQFADAEGKKGGQFYTPKPIVKVLVEMIEPYKGRVFDPCCGSGGMFVQSKKFIEAHEGLATDIAIYGQESNPTTYNLCKMNLAIRQIDADIQWGDSFHNDLHKTLKADFILANPPFNDSDWKGESLQEDVRWKFGVPPPGNANFAWIQHFIHHLSPTGIAGFVLANGSMSSQTSNEGEIRKNIIKKDLVDCIISLPPQLFFNTSIPACLWFLSKTKSNNKYRNRKGEVLFIDVRKMGYMKDRSHKDLTDEEIQLIASTYHAWRGEGGTYEDVPAFCKSATSDDIQKHNYVLTPGRYVGAEDVEDDDEEFEEKMENLTSELGDLFKKSNELEEIIKKNLEDIGYDF